MPVTVDSSNQRLQAKSSSASSIELIDLHSLLYLFSFEDHVRRRVVHSHAPPAELGPVTPASLTCSTWPICKPVAACLSMFQQCWTLLATFGNHYSTFCIATIQILPTFDIWHTSASGLATYSFPAISNLLTFISTVVALHVLPRIEVAGSTSADICRL